MHEHVIEGFRAIATSHEVALTAEKAPLLLVNAHAVVQD